MRCVICDWLPSLNVIFSRFFHIVACISTTFLFITEEYSIVWIYHNLSIHQFMTLGQFHFFGTYECEHPSTKLCKYALLLGYIQKNITAGLNSVCIVNI